MNNKYSRYWRNNIFNTRLFTKQVKQLHKKELVGCEIGVERGINALNMSKKLHPKMLYLIDPYRSYNNETGKKISYAKASKWQQESMKRLRKYNVCFMRGNINDYIDELPMLDFCYIDALHIYKSVKNDIETIYPKIKPGGIIGGHDWDIADVRQAVYDFFEGEVNHDVRDWWVIKDKKIINVVI